MAEHTETFLSLYRADMDAALQVQPVDSWDSFPLFQLLNNFLRTDRKSGRHRLDKPLGQQPRLQHSPHVRVFTTVQTCTL